MTTIAARPTLYRGVQMRSRLEADFAGYLDRGSWQWDYEPTCFGGPGGQWLPDFRRRQNGGLPDFGPVSCTWEYVEVKPLPGEIQKPAIKRLLAQMSVAWLSEPDAYLALVFWTYGADRIPAAIYGWQASPGVTEWCAWIDGWPPLPWPYDGINPVAAALGLEA